MVALDLAALTLAPSFRSLTINTDPMNAVSSSIKTAITGLLPQGLAWNWKDGLVGGRLLGALSDELALTMLLIEKVLREADPQQTLELLPEWEQMLGLPSACLSNLPLDEQARRAAIVDLLRGRQTCTPAYLASIPSVFGFTSTTSNRQVARAGRWRAGVPIWGLSWEFWYALNLNTQQSTANVECLLGTHVPAHVEVDVFQGRFDMHTPELRPSFPRVDMSQPGAPPPPVDFTMSATPSSNTIVAGTNTTATISVQGLFGFSGNTTLSASPAISGVSYGFAPNPIVGGTGSAVLTITTTGGATLGTHTIVVTGVSGALTHTTSFQITITAAPQPDFSLSVAPSSTSVTQGQSTQVVVSNTALNGFSNNINLSATPAIGGVTYSFAPNPMAPNNSATFTITAGLAATLGTQTITVTATDGTITHTATFSLTVNASAPGTENGSATIVSLKAPTSITAINCCAVAYLNCPNYAPLVYFEYRVVGSSAWLSTTPVRIRRRSHWRYANYYMLLEGLTPGTTYEYQVRVTDPTGTLNNTSAVLAQPTRQFTTVSNINDGSQWGQKVHTSGVTMPTWADPGDPTSGEISDTNWRVVKSNAQRAGGTAPYDVIVYGTDNPSGKTPGTVEAYDQNGLVTWTYTVTADFNADTITRNNHGFDNGQALYLTTTGTFPGGTDGVTQYFVVSKTTNTFKLALTKGGAAIDLTSNNTGQLSIVLSDRFYASQWMRNALNNLATACCRIGLEGFDGKRATYDASTTAALSAINNLHIYDENTTSSHALVIGGLDTSESGGRNAFWKNGSQYIPIVGVTFSGIGTVSTAGAPHQVAGEPCMEVSFGSALGGCTNLFFENLKLLSVTGNTSSLPGGQATAASQQTGQAQSIGLVWFDQCEFRAFREGPAPVSTGTYANENGYGTKSHKRWNGGVRIFCTRCRASWTREHWQYHEGISNSRSGRGMSYYYNLRCFQGNVPAPSSSNSNQNGFGRSVLQWTTRADPDAFSNVHVGGISSDTNSSYWDGPPSEGHLLLEDVELDGFVNTGTGGGGTEPYAVYGWLGPITIKNCKGGKGVGFSFRCDTGKGHYLRESTDGNPYVHGPVTVIGHGKTSNNAYSNAALEFNSCDGIDIQSFDLAGINKATFSLYTNDGDGGQDGIVLGENAWAKVTAVGIDGKVSSYTGWATLKMNYRKNLSGEVTYTNNQVDKFQAGVTRGSFSNP